MMKSLARRFLGGATFLFLTNAAPIPIRGQALPENEFLFSLESTSTIVNRDKTVKSASIVYSTRVLLQAKTINVIFPNLGIKRYNFKSIDQDSLGFTSWAGTLEDDPASTATIVEREGKLHGSFHVNGKIFSIEPAIKPGEHLLLERDFRTVAECETTKELKNEN